ncbi:MAG TPA: tRNA (guanosine(37)-N1)-methyltransferase TrmD, partial [Dehalococcoidia bacterium]|nr:tRNA (guanosine(37)-N1)-methyltransferase TrmD [Dehalococcoidia bacterium]
KVPKILLSGNHTEIEKWRRRESLKKTKLQRPDLIELLSLSEEERTFLENI